MSTQDCTKDGFGNWLCGRSDRRNYSSLTRSPRMQKASSLSGLNKPAFSRYDKAHGGGTSWEIISMELFAFMSETLMNQKIHRSV